jgi:hypothetical protein
MENISRQPSGSFMDNSYSAQRTTHMIDRHPETAEYDQRYGRYLTLVPEDGLLAAMAAQSEKTPAFLASIPEEKYDYRYAPEKWTLRDVIGHICDVERAFGYRVLCGARGDEVELKRVDGNLYIQNGDFGRLSMKQLSDEFAQIRKSNVILLQHLPDVAWDRPVKIAGAAVSVRAMGYLMLGHERHHLRIIEEQYLKVS